MPPPSGLDEAGRPRPPVVRIEPERVLKPLAVESPELVSHKLEVLGPESKRLDLVERPDRPRGRGQVEGGFREQGPGEQLLATEVARPQRDRVEEAGAAAIGGGAVEPAPDDEEHLGHRVALAHDVRALCAQGGHKPFAYCIEQLIVHLREERNLKIDESKVIKGMV